MRIAVDAMGGDFAPREIVRGAAHAAEGLAGVSRLFLVGDPAAIQRELSAMDKPPSPKIEIRPASEVVGMDEAPALAIRAPSWWRQPSS
jgi:glycerol-3-phosphate acyltransferase PlsX